MHEDVKVEEKFLTLCAITTDSWVAEERWKAALSEQMISGEVSDTTSRDHNGERWDINLKRKGEQVQEIVRQRKHQPDAIHSIFQKQSNRSKLGEVEFQSAMSSAMLHLEFTCELYEMPRVLHVALSTLCNYFRHG